MGKSTLVTQLGDRINISNIVQTSIVQKVMMGLTAIMQSNQMVNDDGSPEGALGLAGQFKSDEEIIKSYLKMCRHVRKGCNFDI